MVTTRRNVPKTKGLVVSVQLQGLMDIAPLERKKHGIKEGKGGFQNIIGVLKKSRRRITRMGQRPSGFYRKGLAKRKMTGKQMLIEKQLASAFNKDHEDDYFDTKLRKSWGSGNLWKVKLLTDQSWDEAQPLPNHAEEQETSPAFKSEEARESKFPVLVDQKESVSPSHWCSAVASFSWKTRGRKKRIEEDTPRHARWQSPSPRRWNEKQQSTFQARKLKEIINHKKGNLRKINLVRSLQLDFDKVPTVKKNTTGPLGPSGQNRDANGNFEIKKNHFEPLVELVRSCLDSPKEEESLTSDCEEYFSDI